MESKHKVFRDLGWPVLQIPIQRVIMVLVISRSTRVAALVAATPQVDVASSAPVQETAQEREEKEEGDEEEGRSHVDADQPTCGSPRSLRSRHGTVTRTQYEDLGVALAQCPRKVHAASRQRLLARKRNLS